MSGDMIPLRALILYRPRHFINHLLTYLLTYCRKRAKMCKYLSACLRLFVVAFLLFVLFSCCNAALSERIKMYIY